MEILLKFFDFRIRELLHGSQSPLQVAIQMEIDCLPRDFFGKRIPQGSFFERDPLIDGLVQSL